VWGGVVGWGKRYKLPLWLVSPPPPPPPRLWVFKVGMAVFSKEAEHFSMYA